jgi:tetratricopeptide (TPR) repeat protein
MTAHLQRAKLLMETHRPVEAEKEARAGLAQEPQSRDLMHVLADAQIEQGNVKAARETAKSLIGLAPDWVNAHLMACYIEMQVRQYPEAEKFAKEALRLAPQNVVPHQNLAVCLANQGRWQEALQEAEAGLAIDPNRAPCANLRAQALSRVGRGAESQLAAAEALRMAPNSATTQYAAGQVCLEQGDYSGALDRFSEALRLNPNSDQYRAGLVQALKARHGVYRVFLAFSYWLMRQPRGARVVVWVLVYFFLQSIRASIEQLTGPLQVALLVAWIFIFLLVYQAASLFNLVLLFDRRARHALSKKQRRKAIILGVLLGLVLSVAIVVLAFDLIST